MTKYRNSDILYTTEHNNGPAGRYKLKGRLNMIEFKRLEKALAAQHRHDVKEKAAYIQRGYLSTWADEHKTQNDAGLEKYSTSSNWNRYKAGKLTRKEAVQRAAARAEKQLAKEYGKRVEKLHRVAEAPDLVRVDIRVNWVRSRTWGYNPHCEVVIETEKGYTAYTGTASGCGYDKRTAAIGGALNQSDSALKMLYTTKERSKGRIGVEWDDGNQKYIAYGAGYGVLPYFEGGVGMSSFESVFNACGFVLAHMDHNNVYDHYIFERKRSAKK